MLKTKQQTENKSYTVEYVYNLNETPIIDEKQAHSKVFSLRVSPSQYAFLKATENIPNAIRRFIDSLRIEEMGPAEKILVLLHQTKKLQQEIFKLENNQEYREAKRLILTGPQVTRRRATREEFDANYAKYLEMGYSKDELNAGPMNRECWTHTEEMDYPDGYRERYDATNEVIAKKEQEIHDFETEIGILRDKLAEDKHANR